MSNLLTALGIAHGVGALACAAVRGVGWTDAGAVMQVAALAGDAGPWLYLPVPVWLAGAAAGRSRTAGWAAVVPAALFLWWYGPLFLPRPAHFGALLRTAIGERRDSARHMRVLTLNLLFENRSADAVVEAIRTAEADVVALQELTPGAAARIEEQLGARYPYRDLHPHAGPYGGGLLSRFPLEAHASPRELDGILRNMPWQHVRVAAPGGEVSIVNLHLSPPASGSARELPTAWTWSRSQQEREVRAVLPHLAELTRSARPLLVMGDLNTTDQSTTYARLVRLGLLDSFRGAGWGFGHTFPAHGSARLPMIGRRVALPALARIDYVLHSRAVSAERAVVWPAGSGADHHGVLADLALRPAAPPNVS